jgi:hypothetical protein
MTQPEDMACRELVEVITDYLEGVLPEPDQVRFEECPGCRAYLQQMRQTIEALGTLPQSAIPEQDPGKLLELFRDWNARSDEFSH